MDGFVRATATAVGIVFGAFVVVLVVRSHLKKKAKEAEKPPEVFEAELEELVKKAKADLERDKGAGLDKGEEGDLEGEKLEGETEKQEENVEEKE